MAWDDTARSDVWSHINQHELLLVCRDLALRGHRRVDGICVGL